MPYQINHMRTFGYGLITSQILHSLGGIDLDIIVIVMHYYLHGLG